MDAASIPPEPSALAEQYQEKVLATAVSFLSEHGHPEAQAGDLILQNAFKSDDENDMYGFVVVHASGFYCVSARMAHDGRLEDFSCMESPG